MRQVLSILILGLWATTAGAGEFIILPEGTQACFRADKIKTALEQNNISIADCGTTPQTMMVEKENLELFFASGNEFNLLRYGFLVLNDQGVPEDAFLYGFEFVDHTQPATLASEESN